MSEVNGHQFLSRDEFARRKAIQFSSFLQILVEANEYSSDLTISPWAFSVGFSEASMMGINLNDLHWMTRRNWIQCRHGKRELFNEGFVQHEIVKGSEFIILSSGIMALRSAQKEDVAAVPLHSLKVSHANGYTLSDDFSTPKWNVERRELTVSGTVVKRFRWPAPNQEMILSVFSEEGWPSRIEDPLPQGKGLDPKRRLGDTIKCLNRNQNVNLIRFRGDGTGEGILWDIEDI